MQTFELRLRDFMHLKIIARSPRDLTGSGQNRHGLWFTATAFASESPLRQAL
jgi:hypothetical protein